MEQGHTGSEGFLPERIPVYEDFKITPTDLYNTAYYLFHMVDEQEFRDLNIKGVRVTEDMLSDLEAYKPPDPQILPDASFFERKLIIRRKREAQQQSAMRLQELMMMPGRYMDFYNGAAKAIFNSPNPEAWPEYKFLNVLRYFYNNTAGAYQLGRIIQRPR